ncbi:MAG: GNAT family N-acetyltransferase [Actinomycetota bacterium]|nr:GNAT family N-acetyltransferase [Actinomycetota bacterium]
MFSHKLGEHTELRLLEERHAQELTDLTDRNREYLRAWLPWVDANRTVEDRKKFIRGALKQFAENNGFTAGIWHEGRLAGVIGYHSIDWENRTTAVGYWLGEKYQGQGLVTAACRALVDHAFQELGLNRVSIACATENKKSCAIPERLGFRREGVVRQAEWLYDHFVDHVVYATLASEWQIRRS